MALTLSERRGNPRVYIDGPMQYRQVESHDFQPGQIENISAGGALVWIGEDLPIEPGLRGRSSMLKLATGEVSERP